MPLEGDRWFKEYPFEANLGLYFLPRVESLYWSKGIYLNTVKQEWRDDLRIIQCYITYEGIFSTIYKNHFRFLLHISGKSKLNLKSIIKRATRVKSHIDHTSQSIFQHSLVKLLLVTELKKKNRSWQHFWLWSSFEPERSEAQDDQENQINKEDT